MKYWKQIMLTLGVFGCMQLGFIHNVLAADWYYIGASATEEQYSVDDSRVEKNDKEATMWIRVNQLNKDYYGEKVQLNREAKTIQILDLRLFHTTGIPYSDDEYTYDRSVQPITPDTMGAEIYKLVWNN